MSHDPTLRAELARASDWNEAHIRFEEAVKDFPTALAGRKLEGAAHTPWQLLEHLRIVLEDLVAYTRDAEHQSPSFPAGYWPPTEAPPDDAAWQASVAAHRGTLLALSALISEEGTDLLSPNVAGHTPLREVLLALDHNAYHLGQFVLLRQILEQQNR